MAHIFKHPTSNAKGILVLTHKEIRYLFSNHQYFQPKLSLKDRLRGKTFSEEVIPEFKEDFARICKSYHIGVHFGWIHENYPTLRGVDFYLVGDSTVKFENPDEVFSIPMNSSNFIPSCFYNETPKSENKQWDIIMVARDVRWKNIDKFLSTVRQLYDSGYLYDVLLVIPTNNNENRDNDPKTTYTEIMDDYQRMFSYEERGRFSILKTHIKMPFLGLAQPQLAKFFHLSKVFTLYSQSEGGSRVISEALLSGLPVVVKSDLSGGGRDFLDSSNAVFFEDFGTAHLSLIEAVENWKTLNTNREKVIELTHEKKSLERLKKHLEVLYTKHNETFDGELINLDWINFRLSAHWHEGLEWADKRFISPDVTSKEQFRLLLKQLNL